MSIMISVPDQLKSLAEPIQRLVAGAASVMARAAGGRALEYAKVEREIGERTAEIERAAHRDILADLDVDAPQVVIDGQIHTRVHRTEGRYYTMAGDVAVERSLYRAERNGKVVDAISLRAGALDGGWLPETAKAMAHLLQRGTAREAEDTAKSMARLPYSRSSFERVGHEVGKLYAAKKTETDDALIVALQVPKEARAVSFDVGFKLLSRSGVSCRSTWDCETVFAGSVCRQDTCAPREPGFFDDSVVDEAFDRDPPACVNQSVWDSLRDGL